MRLRKSSDHARSFPSQLKNILDAAEGPQQDQAWTEFLDFYSRLIIFVARQTPGDYDGVMDRYAYIIEHLRDQNFRRLRTFIADGRGKFTTWLTLVVRRLCFDLDRLKHGRVSAEPGARDAPVPSRLIELVFDSDLLERVPSGRATVDEELERAQLLDQLATAVAALSPGDQLLLTLRHRDERTAGEIASLMSLPTPFHVYRRLTRIHAALREALTTIPVQKRAAGAVHPSSAVQ